MKPPPISTQLADQHSVTWLTTVATSRRNIRNSDLGVSSVAATLQDSSLLGARDVTFCCPFCPAEFTSKIGLGVHKRKAHPTLFFEQEVGASKPVKPRWSESEISNLAHAEVSLLMQGVKFVNQELVKQFPDRTLESIKGKRKAPAYRNLVT